MRALSVLFIVAASAPSVARAQSRADQVAACLEADAEQAQRAPLPVTAEKDYIVPLLNATFGSAWCKCRDVGTSPHIGQDYYDPAIPNHSLAMSNGVVKSVRYLQDCGYEVMFEDSGGALWRYLHLNKPSYGAGQQMWRGDIVGVHQTYPKSSCGTGPHLHLERHVAGDHGGALTSATWQYGRKEGNYDPVTMFRTKHIVKTEAEREQVVAASKKAASAAPSPAPAKPAPQLAGACLVCSFFQPQPEPVAAQVFDLDPTASLAQRAILNPARDRREVLEWSAVLSSDGVANPSNLCSSGSDCVTKIEFQVQLNNESWVRLFADSSVRNRPLALVNEAAYCWPSNGTVNYRVVAWTLEGRQLMQTGQVERPE